MRPGVYASVMRNRKTNVRRVHTGRHQYSWRGFFIALFVGLFLFVPGLIVTIIGVETKDASDLPEDSVQSTGYNDIVNERLYKVIGPAALVFGIFLICSAGIYYSCWGFRSTVRRPHSHKHKKSSQHSEQQDPLQPNIYKTCTCKKHPKAVPTISNQSHVSTYSSVRSKGSPTTNTKFVEELDRINSNTNSPDIRSCRQGQHYHNHHVHPSSPKPYTVDGVSHRCSSRHRSTSQSPPRAHTHPHPHPHQCNHHHSQTPDPQVTFINTDAPLAEGESGSMDISIDLSTEVPAKGLKY